MKKQKPLISSESPSMRRARKEYQDPSPAPDPAMIAALSAVVEREHAIAAAYWTARDGDAADVHARRASRLAALVSELGGAAPEPGDADGRSIPVSADEIEYLQGAEQKSALARDEAAVADAYADALNEELPADVADQLRAIRAL